MQSEQHFIRPVKQDDVAELLEMIRELAIFEKLEDMLVATEEDLKRVLFEESGGPEALVAESSEGDLVGYAIYFENFSTFLCRRGLYLEDIYIRPSQRKQGIGKSFLKRLASIARERSCGRMEWVVLDWNQNAIDFYESIGGDILHEWKIVRLTTNEIGKLADQSPEGG
jgi:GNAT superfamily N-acetyltransferase